MEEEMHSALKCGWSVAGTEGHDEEVEVEVADRGVPNLV